MFFESFNIVNFATALHRIAKASDGRNVTTDLRFRNLARTVALLCADGLAKDEPYTLVSTLRSFGKAAHVDVRVIEPTLTEVVNQMHEYHDFTSAELSQLVWAFGTSQVTCRAVVSATADVPEKESACAQDTSIAT